MGDKKLRTFIILFTVCVIGTIAIFLFAVGIENGHPLANRILKSALNYKALVFIGAILAGFLVWLYTHKDS